MIRKFMLGLAAAGGSLMAAGTAWAQEAAAPAAENVVAAVVDKGDTAWMMTSTLLVLLMILPGLALFYGGLTRTKNMLATMTQIGAAACLAMVIWVAYGYGLAHARATRSGARRPADRGQAHPCCRHAP